GWEDAPPEPEYWMQQLWGVTHAPRFEEPTFRAKLKAMVDEIKTPETSETTVPNRKMKIEFLFFKDCPGYRQALSNLKAAVRETRTKSDLVLVPVNSEDDARKTNFQGSPSIRVNGKDLDGKDDSPSYSCRVYQIGGRMTGTPTKEFIRERLTRLHGAP
ncbi:MAG TPA: hypothetical protein VFV34_22280, partial [Blastocatellia bacterium]|nr:hypothetical protein [Blastocatellia bacterium]